MSESESLQEIQTRLAKLEAEVARLSALVPAASAPPMAPQPPPTPPPLPRPAPPASAPVPKPAPKPRKESNPTILIAAIGAGIFLLGAIFFLSLAIQRGWIGPEMRLLLGLLTGSGLTVLATRLILKDRRAIGTCLLAAGIGTFIFSLRVGAFSYHFFPPLLGFAGTAIATVYAGALAARIRFSPPMAVALLAGLIAPPAFSEGGHHEVALACYLAVLMGACLAVPYLSKIGARWGTVRWLALVGTWLLLTVAVMDVQHSDAPLLLGLLALHAVLAGLWIWLPGVEERPSTPTLLYFLMAIGNTSLAWALWLELGWMRAAFSGVALLMAFIHLVLVKPIRRRLGSRKADLGLLVLAGGHLALAIPIALEWAWVGPLWGLFALGVAWAVRYAEQHPDWEADEVRSLILLAMGFGTLATFQWLTGTVDVGIGAGLGLPFLNRHFLQGALTAGAWLLLARSLSPVRIMGFLGFQIVGVITLAMEFSQLAHKLGGGYREASIAITFVWALAGAGQWLSSLWIRETTPRRALAFAGYGWLALGSFKLLVIDLASVDLLLRALAFLGIGALFLATALIASSVRKRQQEEQP